MATLSLSLSHTRTRTYLLSERRLVWQTTRTHQPGSLCSAAESAPKRFIPRWQVSDAAAHVFFRAFSGGLFQCPRCASASSPPPRRPLARRSPARPAQHPHATHSSDRLSGSASHDRTCHLGDSQRRSQPVIATQKHAHPAVWSPDRHNPQEGANMGALTIKFTLTV